MNLFKTSSFLTFLCLLNQIFGEGTSFDEAISFPLIHSRSDDGTFLRNFKQNIDNLQTLLSNEHKKWNLPLNLRNFDVNPAQIPLLDYSDDFYLVNVSMGTPPQSFLLMPSTFFSDVWVIDSDCKDEYCIEVKNFTKHPFDKKASTTYTEQKDSEEVVTNLFIADVGSDILRIGELSGRQNFMIATSLSKNDSLDGFLGLGWPSLAMVSGNQPPIITLSQKMKEKVITVWMKSRKSVKNPEIGGQITFGGRNPEHCQDNWKYSPLYSGQLDYWQFQMDGFSIGELKNHRKHQVVSAMEFFAIYAPVGVVNALAKEINAEYNDDYKVYVVKCDGKNLPDLVIKINGADFPVPASEYVLDFSDTNPEIGKDNCVLGVVPYENRGHGPAWILGNPFTRTYCTVFDIANKRIGYSNVKIIN